MSAFRARAKILSQISYEIPVSRPISGRHENLKTRLNQSIAELKSFTTTREKDHECQKPRITLSRSLFSLFRRNVPNTEKNNHNAKSLQDAEKEEKGESWLKRMLPKQPRKFYSQERCIPQNKQEVGLTKIPNSDWQPNVVIVKTDNSVTKQNVSTGQVVPPTLSPIPPQSVETQLLELQEKHVISPTSNIEVDMNKYTPKLPYSEFKPEEKNIPEKLSVASFEDNSAASKDLSDNTRKRSTFPQGHRVDRKLSWYTQQSVKRTEHAFDATRSNKALIHTSRRNLEYFTHRNCIDKHSKGHSLQMQVNKRKAQIQNKEMLRAYSVRNNHTAKHLQNNSNINLHERSISKVNVIDKSQSYVPQLRITNNQENQANTPLNIFGDPSQVPLLIDQKDKHIVPVIKSKTNPFEKIAKFQTMQQKNSKTNHDLKENKSTSDVQQFVFQVPKNVKKEKLTKQGCLSWGLIGTPHCNTTNDHKKRVNFNLGMQNIKNQKHINVQKFTDSYKKQESIFKEEEKIDTELSNTLPTKENIRNWIKRIEAIEKTLGNNKDNHHTKSKKSSEELSKQFTSHNKIKYGSKHYATNNIKSKVANVITHDKLKKKKNKLEHNQTSDPKVKNNISQSSNRANKFPESLTHRLSSNNIIPLAQQTTELAVQKSLTKYLSERLRSQQSYLSQIQRDILGKDVLDYTKAKSNKTPKKAIKNVIDMSYTSPSTQLHPEHGSDKRKCAVNNNLLKKYETFNNNFGNKPMTPSVANSEKNTNNVINISEKDNVTYHSKKPGDESDEKHSYPPLINKKCISNNILPQEHAHYKVTNERDSFKTYLKDGSNVCSVEQINNHLSSSVNDNLTQNTKITHTFEVKNIAIEYCMKELNNNHNKYCRIKYKLPNGTFHTTTPDEYSKQTNKISGEKSFPTDSLTLKVQPEIHYETKCTDNIKQNISNNKDPKINITSHTTNTENTVEANKKTEEFSQNNETNENSKRKNREENENSVPEVISTDLIKVLDTTGSQTEWSTHNKRKEKSLDQTYLNPKIVYESTPLKPTTDVIPLESLCSTENKTSALPDFASYFHGTVFSKSDMLNMYLDKAVGSNKECSNMFVDNTLIKEKGESDQNIEDRKTEEFIKLNYSNEKLEKNDTDRLMQKESIQKEERKNIDESLNMTKRNDVDITNPSNIENNTLNTENQEFENTTQKNASHSAITHSSMSPSHSEVQCSTRRNYSSYTIKEPYRPNNGAYNCSGEKKTFDCKKKKTKSVKIEKSKKPKPKDSLKKIDCPPKHSEVSDCKKIHLPGCRSPTLKCADEPIVQLPCVKKEPPSPSFSECLKYPFGKKKSTECDCYGHKWAKCPPPIEKPKVYDQCKKPVKKQAKKKDVCDRDSDDEDEDNTC